MIVLDASVAVKWYVPEQHSDEADALLESPDQLLAPELIRIEVTSALVRKARVGHLPPTRVRELLVLWAKAWTNGTLLLASDEVDLPAATELALDLAHPLQDCVYLALAMRLNAPLITADRRFAERAQRNHGAVSLLGGASAAAH